MDANITNLPDLLMHRYIAISYFPSIFTSGCFIKNAGFHIISLEYRSQALKLFSGQKWMQISHENDPVK